MSTEPEKPLLERTISLLEHAPRRLKLKDIARATGLGESWLSRFQRGHFDNPGVKHIQILHDYLANLEG